VAIRLDHVVIAVSDLASAAAHFQDTLGFSLKPGRLHRNGLRNIHVRLADGSALELMSAGEGEADVLSEWYQRFLAQGEGGAFVALRAGPPDTVLDRLGKLAADAIVFDGPAFDWVSFPEEHPLHAVFFIHVTSRVQDDPAHLRHRNGATGLAEVWVQTTNREVLADVLARFGAESCGELAGPGDLTGGGYGLARGALVIVPCASPGSDPRVLAVVLDGKSSTPQVHTAGIWLRWRGGQR
jgi:catechol 2,3-dioxygenase-like lactoylglutathione lyase family enzyme